MALTAEQKNHFEEQGYLPFGRVLSGEELSALRRRSEEIARGEAGHVPERYVQLEAAFRQGEGEGVDRLDRVRKMTHLCYFDPLFEAAARKEAIVDVIEELLQVDCHGLTGPWGYCRGLVDRPDLLQILRDNGIRWIRTNARDHRDCQPTPFSEQPFFYADQGFPEILELGIQGYQDHFYWERFDDRSHGESYQDYLFAMVDETARNGWLWNLCSHDHGTPTRRDFEEKCGWLGDLIARAKATGLRFASPPEIYEELKAGR